MTDQSQKGTTLVASVFSMILPTLAILLLGAKNISSGFGRDASTLRILGLSALLGFFGILSGTISTKEAFTRIAVGFSIVVLILSVVMLGCLK